MGKSKNGSKHAKFNAFAGDNAIGVLPTNALAAGAMPGDAASPHAALSTRPPPMPRTSVQTPSGEQIEIHARRFYLYRHEDPSGVSGTGKVAEGTEYLCGMCTLNFISPHGHVGTYINMRALTSVHGHGGKTEVIYVDG